MLAFLVLAASLLIGFSTCAVPVARGPEGNFILPGARSNLASEPAYSLDAYAPAGEPRPAAVIIHGSSGSRSTHVNQLFPLLDKAGYAWFSVDYGSADDVRAAIEYIRCPGRFNITNKFVVIGVDSGAQVILEHLSNDSTGEGSNIGSSTGLIGGEFPAGLQELVMLGAKFSPTFLESTQGGSGPQTLAFPAETVLMFHGTSDDEFPVSQAESLCKRMLHCVFESVPGGIHDFENWHPDQWYWKEELTAWLRGDRRGLWKDIPYSRPDGRDLLLDAYVPEGKGPFPAVIIVHGGGWEAGDRITYVSPVFAPLAQAGFAWFSIDYRLTPYVHVPEQLEDVRNAVRFVRQHAGWFHVDPNRIALVGESASGHLVAQLVSMPCPGCEVQAVVSFYGVYNFERWKNDAEFSGMLKRLFVDTSPAVLREYSPLNHVSASLPPMLIIQGTADELYAGTQEYVKRLGEVRARDDVILLDKAPHGMENWEGHPEWMFYKSRMVEWLKKTLGADASELR
jgi:acetyl esterase